MDRAQRVSDARSTDTAERLAKALEQVMGWVNAWEPNFTQDDEWPETRDAAKAALAAYRAEKQP